MRTTLDIDDDVLQAAKELATKERRTAGSVLSELARRGFHREPSISAGSSKDPSPVRNGFEMLPRRGEPVSLAHVRKLLDEEGI